MLAWITENPNTSIKDADQEGCGGEGNGVIGAPGKNSKSSEEYSGYECRGKNVVMLCWRA